jgi:sensor domain CHASE-containing protein
VAATPEAFISRIRRVTARAVGRLPLVVLIGGMLTALVVWQYLAAERNRTLQNLLEARVHAYAELVGARLGSVQISIARAAQWWITLNGTPQAAWEIDSRTLLEDHSALNRLQWVNQDLNQRWMVMRNSAIWIGNAPVPLTTAQRAALQRAAAENRAYFDIHDPAPDGGQSLAYFYVPVRAHNVGNGFIAGAIDIDQVMRRAYDDLSLASGITLFRGNTPVYAIGRSVPSAGGLSPVSVTVSVAGEDFRIESAPTPQFMAQNTSSEPLVFLGIFVAAAALVALLMQLQLRAVERNHKLTATQQALDASEERAREQAK